MIVTGKTDHSAKNGNTNDTTHAYKWNSMNLCVAQFVAYILAAATASDAVAAIVEMQKALSAFVQ